MIQDVNAVLIDMPVRISAYTVANPDLSYTVIINSRLTRERQVEAYIHELRHINNGDFDKKCNADIIEIYAHK